MAECLMPRAKTGDQLVRLRRRRLGANQHGEAVDSELTGPGGHDARRFAAFYERREQVFFFELVYSWPIATRLRTGNSWEVEQVGGFKKTRGGRPLREQARLNRHDNLPNERLPASKLLRRSKKRGSVAAPDAEGAV